MTLQWIEQKRGRCCGQIAVAVATGRPLAEIKAEIGRRGGTKTQHLVRALRESGFAAADRCMPHTQFVEVPDLCLAQLRRDGKSSWHWIVICDGIVFDGERSGPMAYADYVWYQKTQGWRITSYLPFRPRLEVQT